MSALVGLDYYQMDSLVQVKQKYYFLDNNALLEAFLIGQRYELHQTLPFNDFSQVAGYDGSFILARRK